MFGDCVQPRTGKKKLTQNWHKSQYSADNKWRLNFGVDISLSFLTKQLKGMILELLSHRWYIIKLTIIKTTECWNIILIQKTK